MSDINDKTVDRVFGDVCYNTLDLSSKITDCLWAQVSYEVMSQVRNGIEIEIATDISRVLRLIKDGVKQARNDVWI